MSLFTDLISELLGRGHSVRFLANGQSMHPTIKDGEEIVVEPVAPSGVKVGEVLLYRSHRGVIAHRVVAIEHGGDKGSGVRGVSDCFILKGDALDACDDPVEAGQVLGKVVAVERNGRSIDLSSRRAKILHSVRLHGSRLRYGIRRQLRAVRQAGQRPLAGQRRSLLWLAPLLWLLLSVAGPAQAQMRLLTGSYTGDGSDNRQITGVGFQPDMVIIKGDLAQVAVIRTSTMGTDESKPMTGGTALFADRIQTFESSGFTIGTNLDVNSSGKTYYWIAFKAAAGTMAVGSYTGNVTDNRSITGVGFQPDYVIVMSSGGQAVVHRSSAMTGDTSVQFNGAADASNLIQALESDGFQVGTDAQVNGSGTVYHYVAWKVVAGTMNVGLYTGNGTDNRSITGVGFEPEYVIIKANTGQTAAHKSASTGSTTDTTLRFIGDANVTNAIQAFESDGFQVGTNNSVNTATGSPTYYWMAFARSNPTAVTLTALTATATAEGTVLLQWQTGYEVDNLGFHVYREQDGQRVRITPELLAGSALFAGPGTTLTAGHPYAWLDETVRDPASSALRYWLEERDLTGQSTWHGPVPVQPAPSSTPTAAWARARLLRDLGRDATPSSTRSSILDPPSSSLSTQSSSLGSPSALAPQWALAAGPAVKLLIRQPGWYRVGQPALRAAGLDPQVDPRTLQLVVGGQEVPLLVRGERDGRFDPSDAIEFYGTGLETPATDTNVYWLTWGASRGQRVQAVRSRGRGSSPPSFPFTVERKERTVYFAALKNGDAENFFGPVLAGVPVEQTLPLTHLDPAPPGEATLEVSLQGVTTGPHQVQIALNGTDLGTLAFAGQTLGRLQLPIPPSLLHEGDNRVTLVPQGGEADVSLVDTVTLTYWHTYTADGDTLPCTAPGGTPVTLHGFSTPPRVWDITDPTAVRELRGTVQGGTLTVTPPGAGTRTLLALTDARIQPPAALQANQPSTWHQAAHAADLLLIAPADFVDSLAPLRALREAQGFTVAILDLDDLYDEFTFGVKSPAALRAFLTHARQQWTRPPRFALLVGGASVDPRNYLGLGDFDRVPTKLVDTAYLETASDDWFADSNNDGIPELALGRLPVQTPADAATVIGKLVGYAQTGAGSWTHQALLVADVSDIFDFTAASLAVGALLPLTMTVQPLFLDALDLPTARATLLSTLTQGLALVNYVGHGSVDRWRGDLLTAADAAALTNGWQLPVVITMDCLNGLFHDPRLESLAAALLTAEQGGAVAVWASSGLTAPQEQAVMNAALYQRLFDGSRPTLGEAIVQAKAAVRDPDIRRTWLLFGDPTLRLQ